MYVCVYVCIYVQEINSLGKSSESLITFQKLFENSCQSHVANGFELVPRVCTACVFVYLCVFVISSCEEKVF